MADAEQDAAAFETQVARVRDSGWLGRSQSLSRLFDLLAQARRDDRPLREADLAHEVFGRRDDLAGDASVRVYVHRLRRKLAEFYAGPGAGEPIQLTVPLGDYRLDLRSAVADAPTLSTPSRRWRAPLVVALLLLLNLAAWLWVRQTLAPERELAALARRPPWSLISGQRPVLVVVGDYYIFGETDGLEIQRMIREFNINSADDLAQFLMDNPRLQGRYVDMDTNYTPTGASVALKDVLPIAQMAARGRRRVQVITSSSLTPEMLKSADIIYVGYLSGLRLLEQPVFATARLKIGDNYDALVDKRTGRRFSSTAEDAARNQTNIDYGYLRAFAGPAGNHIIIIAGTRDIGVAQMAETAASQIALSGSAKGAPLEKLYEVRGVGRTSLSAHEVDLSPQR